jgi:peptidoglycan hydrolase-like protein with peptidoglycan-binding domain
VATTPAVPAPTTTLKPGDTGAQVKRLQRALLKLGYTVGTVDGDYGTATKTAVEQFQTASHLTADGIFGAETRVALIAALKTG